MAEAQARRDRCSPDISRLVGCQNGDVRCGGEAMRDTFPRVSLGMPVFNAEQHIEEAIESLLAQSFGDFEIVISDNASSDGTEEICRTYVTKDDRIRYFRNRANYG